LKRIALLPAVAMAVALVPFSHALPASAAPTTLSTVSITVSLDLPHNSSKGPAVFQVTDATVGAGPELTGADLVSNPSSWGGSVTVDVDNTDGTITIATDEPDSFETADVTITSPGLGAITLVSDNLWMAQMTSSAQKRAAGGSLVIMALTSDSKNGTATIDWATSNDLTAFRLNPTGKAIFSFTQIAPTTTTTTAAPTTTAPPAAAMAVTAAPAFTG
jgi:hypothetical protein